MMLNLAVSRRSGLPPITIAFTLSLAALSSGGSPCRAQADVKPMPKAVSVPPKKSGDKLDPNFNSVSGLKAFIRTLKEQAEANRDADEEKEREAAEKKGEKVKAESEEERERKSGVPDFIDALLYYTQMRAYPFDQINADAISQAADARDRMPSAVWDTSQTIIARPTPRTNAVVKPISPTTITSTGITQVGSRWEFIGPRNLPVPYNVYYGPTGSATSGRINGIAYAPSNASIAYLATAGGGVWKSTNGGIDWLPVGDGFSFLYTSSIAVDPKDPNTVYVGMGDFDGQYGRGYIGGLYKSIDGGQTWTAKTGSGATILPKVAVSSIVIDPDNSQIVLISTGRSVSQSTTYPTHIYRSADGGETWTAVDGVSNIEWWSDLKAGIKPSVNAAPYLYAFDFYYGTDPNANGLYRSADRGLTWQKTNLPFAASSYDNKLVRLAPSPTNADTVYLISSGDRAIYKGVRAAGDTATVPAYNWQTITGNYPTETVVGNANYNWSQATYYDLHLTAAGGLIGGVTQDILYGGTISISGSVGASGTWTNFGDTYNSTARTHNDQHSMAINPSDPTKGLVGNDGGVYGLSYNTGTGAWTLTNTNSRSLGLTQFVHADWHPTDPTKAIGGAQDNASPAATGDLLNWKNVGAGDGAGCAISVANPNYQYNTVYNAQVIRTTNGWASYGDKSPTVTGDRLPFITAAGIDPNTTYFYVGTQYLYRLDDRTGAGTWTNRVGGQDLTNGGLITAISVALGDSNRIYTGSNDGRVFVSLNFGTNWTNITSNLPNRAITSVSINPLNKNDILVGLSGTGTDHLYRGTLDTSGATPVITFTSVSGTGATALPNFPLNDVTRDPSSPGTAFYVATDGGVFVSMDSGATWSNATAPLGLPNIQATAIKAIAGTGYLNVATFGRGMWRIPLPTASVASAAPPNLGITYTLASSGGNNNFTVSVTNTGGTASGVVIAVANLKTKTATVPANQSLPITIGTISANGTAVRTLSFPVSGLPSGTAAVLSVSGTYNGGSFSSSLRVTIP